ncbi:PREDICTED: putative dual specificity protein phosphatase DSP8 [Camelina sativa]|uniref:Dual specificity protein phosphatase DSP8 n=1 Tax=Camelina sativa TaxID=90675 RepID=A0ABM0WQS6_CAMSA|nr:PREDICTED: putative dual specificity protein phosphatase DSP8 [Camelina sativa]
MYIEELKEEGDEILISESNPKESIGLGGVVSSTSSDLGVWNAKRALVGAGGRALFYPTLIYNLLRNMLQSEFRWWDQVDEYVLLGAVPFPTHVPLLKELGVYGVITLNEPFETLVPSSLYHAHGIKHLVIPTRDYLFAPSITDICQAVNFIHENASSGKTTYVHCKAGRGRSTTIVLCYLVKYRDMTPECAYEYIRSIRPRVLLASAQWKAVKEFYSSRMARKAKESNLVVKRTSLRSAAEKQLLSVFDDGSVVVVTESDLAGYDEPQNIGGDASSVDVLPELSLACKVHYASQAAFARISCLWLKSPRRQVHVDQLQSLGVNIKVC